MVIFWVPFGWVIDVFYLAIFDGIEDGEGYVGGIGGIEKGE